MAEELTFHLEEFEGPLELLLALVTKHKMDLHNIPILELIDQYTATVARADPDPEAASAFIEKSSTRPIPSSMSCCALSRTMTSTGQSRTGTVKLKANTPLSAT